MCFFCDGDHWSDKNVIDFKKYSSTRKLHRIPSWVKGFANNVKEKVLNNAILLLTFVTVQELKRAQFQWIKRNQKIFGSIKLKSN